MQFCIFANLTNFQVERHVKVFAVGTLPDALKRYRVGLDVLYHPVGINAERWHLGDAQWFNDAFSQIIII